MNMSSNRWVALAVIVVVVLVIWNLWEFKGGEEAMQNPQASASPTASPTPQSGGFTSGGGTSFTQTQVQTYSAVVSQYEGRRIQFDDQCQSQPTEVTYKNGTTLMFDNRSAMAKTVKIGDQTYEFPPYGYKILTLNSVSLPATLNVSCNNSVNVLKILLQANILGQ